MSCAINQLWCSVLKKIGENWLTFRQNLNNNTLHNNRFRYDVLYHTDLSRYKGLSNGIPLERINWGNYDLLVIEGSHNFRNNDPRKEKETRYQRLMREVIQSGVKTIKELSKMPEDYGPLLMEIKERRVRATQYQALKAVNKELVGLYSYWGPLQSRP